MSSALTVFTHYISCLRFNVKVLQRENVLNCKKRRGRRKEKWDTGRGVLPPRPAIGSSPGNTKAFSEWIGSPKHSHKRTHSNIVNKTENLAVLSPCVLQKERYQFECQQLTVVLPVMRLVLKSICRLQSPKKKKGKEKNKLSVWPNAGMYTAHRTKTLKQSAIRWYSRVLPVPVESDNYALSLSLPLTKGYSLSHGLWGTLNQTTRSLTNHKAAAGWCNHSHTDLGAHTTHTRSLRGTQVDTHTHSHAQTQPTFSDLLTICA